MTRIIKEFLTQVHWKDEIVAKVLQQLVDRELLQEAHFAGHQRRHNIQELTVINRISWQFHLQEIRTEIYPGKKMYARKLRSQESI